MKSKYSRRYQSGPNWRQRRGDTAEYYAAAFLRASGYWVYFGQSGPIDIVAVHEETGATRLFDVKSSNDRINQKTRGRRINRIIRHPIKEKVNIEIIYVDKDGNVDFPYQGGRKQWLRDYKPVKNHLGQLTGKYVRRTAEEKSKLPNP